MSPSPPKKKRRRYKDINSSHKTKTDCPVEGCKMMQKRMDHLKSHYILMVVWYGGNPILSDSAGYHTASKEAQDHTDHARSRKFKRHSIPSFKIVNKQPTLLDQMLSGAGPTRKPASDEEGGGGGEALSLNSGPPSPLSLAPDTEEGTETRS